MAKKVTVKNGTIILPAELHDHWENKDAEISEYGTDRIVIERISSGDSKIDRDAWKHAAGLLKNAPGPDPVEWQRKIRKEWDRKLP